MLLRKLLHNFVLIEKMSFMLPQEKNGNNFGIIWVAKRNIQTIKLLHKMKNVDYQGCCIVRGEMELLRVCW